MILHPLITIIIIVVVIAIMIRLLVMTMTFIVIMNAVISGVADVKGKRRVTVRSAYPKMICCLFLLSCYFLLCFVLLCFVCFSLFCFLFCLSFFFYICFALFSFNFQIYKSCSSEFVLNKSLHCLFKNHLNLEQMTAKTKDRLL